MVFQVDAQVSLEVPVFQGAVKMVLQICYGVNQSRIQCF